MTVTTSLQNRTVATPAHRTDPGTKQAHLYFLHQRDRHQISEIGAQRSAWYSELPASCKKATFVSSKWVTMNFQLLLKTSFWYSTPIFSTTVACVRSFVRKLSRGIFRQYIIHCHCGAHVSSEQLLAMKIYITLWLIQAALPLEYQSTLAALLSQAPNENTHNLHLLTADNTLEILTHTQAPTKPFSNMSLAAEIYSIPSSSEVSAMRSGLLWYQI